ncbi:MAG: hypothetical protein R3F56_19795 [Planctomycetota bacterium]
MRSIPTLSLLFAVSSHSLAGQASASEVFTEVLRARAEAQAAQGKGELALATAKRAVEHDGNDLANLRLLATLALAQKDKDLGAVALHRWLELARASKPVPFAAIGEVEKQLASLDADAKGWDTLRNAYLRLLASAVKEQEKRKDPAATLAVHRHVLAIDPKNAAAARGVAAACKALGLDPDAYLPRDLDAATSDAWRHEQDAKHDTWAKAWQEKTAHFTVRTDAGREVLTLAASAVEAAYDACVAFFPPLPADAPFPRIEVRIAKSRDDHAQNFGRPADAIAAVSSPTTIDAWADAQLPRRDLRRALCGAVAEVFSSLALPHAPPWLRHGSAARFAAADLAHDGRLAPAVVDWAVLATMAQRCAAGTMASADGDATKAPTARMLVGGEAPFGPTWMPPASSLVSFLLDHRDGTGRRPFHGGLRTWMQSCATAAPTDLVDTFAQAVLAAADSPAKSVDALTGVWHRSVLAARDRATMATDPFDPMPLADGLLRSGARVDALPVLEEACRARPEDAAAWAKLGKLQEGLERTDDAVSSYRAARAWYTLRGDADSAPAKEAGDRLQSLDPTLALLGKAHAKAVTDGMALVERYRAANLPSLALLLAERLADDLGVAEALPAVAELAAGERARLLPWHGVDEENTLRGFRAAEGFRATGAGIVAQVPGELPPPRPIGVNTKPAASEEFDAKFLTRQLLLDVATDGDFSLEAEMRVANDGNGGYLGARMGLCFAVKDETDFRAVLLQPTDVLDFVTCAGGTFTAQEHRPWMVDNHWLRLRIDVLGTRVSVFLDGAFLRTYELPSLAAAHGGLGLVAGVGQTMFRNVRYAPRDVGTTLDVAERVIATKKRALGTGVRQMESFVGIEPPILQAREWVQGEPVRLGDLRGRPVVLAFWSVEQDRAIPCTRLFDSLVERGKDKNVALVVFCDGGSDEAKVKGYLASHPMPTAHVGVDDGNLTLGAYAVKGLPLILLLGPDGRVVYQGSANLELSNGWNGGPTQLDDPLAELLR